VGFAQLRNLSRQIEADSVLAELNFERQLAESSHLERLRRKNNVQSELDDGDFVRVDSDGDYQILNFGDSWKRTPSTSSEECPAWDDGFKW
jgi:hypothetical protein